MSLDSKTDSLVEQYVRAPQPQSPEALPQYLEQELQRIEAFTQDASHGSVTVANVEPEVKKKGTVRYAVSPWDPIGGSFQGLVVYNGSAWVRVDTDTNTQNTLSDLGITSSAANINKYTAGTDLVIDASGNVGIGTTSPHTKTEIVTTASGSVSESLQIRNNATASGTGSKIRMINSTDVNSDANSVSITSNRSNNDNFMTFETEDTERMRIDAHGHVFIGATSEFVDSSGTSAKGIQIHPDGILIASRDGSVSAILGRSADDGQVVQIRQDGSTEGTISVSGSTVSYGGFVGLHESSGIATSTPIGTVVSTIDELDVYPVGTPKAGQNRADHSKVKVSDTVGDKRVYGVVQKFDAEYFNKLQVASVGVGSVRVTGACAGGDLLESNGDGTAKVQSDDIVRSKTIGKVTIGNSSSDVKLVSCVLYCG